MHITWARDEYVISLLYSNLYEHTIAAKCNVCDMLDEIC